NGRARRISPKEGALAVASAYLKRGRWYLSYKNAHGAWVAEASTAKTKTEARRLADEIERRAERERRGLDEGQGSAAAWSVGDLLRWWLETYSSSLAAHDTNKLTIERHLLSAPIASMNVTRVGPGDIEQLLHERSSILAPQTVNHLRSYLSRAFGS